MMRVLCLTAFFTIAANTAPAQEFSATCQPIFDAVAAENPTNFEQCEPTVAEYELLECEPPKVFNSTRPTSHLILAIDASGSMAGKVGAESKMAVAQREAKAFLADLPKEVAVGLVVYGHKGDNTKTGRAESCATSEMVHGFDAPRAFLNATIEGLRPTGWTPLGGVLGYAGEVIADLPPATESDPIAPVVLLLSDGEETCDGDPVGQAKLLLEAGVQTTVNTIGFDVDAKTAAQLEQIAEVGGGTFYAADSAKALRARLNAIKEAEAAVIWYNYCVRQNVGRIHSVYHNAGIELAGCYQRNNPARQRSKLFNVINKLRKSEGPEAACVDELNTHALDGYSSSRYWLSDRATALNEKSRNLADAYREAASLDALTAAK